MQETHPQAIPVISIVIPTYNTSGVLRECLSGLAEQAGDTTACEVIVVNDGGKDESSASLGHFGDKLAIRYVRQEHRGPAAARNLGVRMARADIVAFLDDDSVPLKDWLERTISAWRETPESDGIGGYVAIDPADSIYCRVNAGFFNWYLDQQISRPESAFLATCNASYRKSSLEKIGGFDTSFERACGEDRDVNLRLVRSGGKLRLDAKICVYHDRDLTLTAFIRKNYYYGMAACRIYAKYPEQRYISTPGYAALFSSLYKRYGTWWERATALALLVLSQVSTAVGFVAGKVSRTHSHVSLPAL